MSAQGDIEHASVGGEQDVETYHLAKSTPQERSSGPFGKIVQR